MDDALHAMKGKHKPVARSSIFRRVLMQFLDFLSFMFTQYAIWLSPISRGLITVQALFMPLITRLTTKPDLPSITLLLVVLYVSLKLMNMLRRAVVFWVMLAFRLVFWGGLGIAALYVYNRGIEDTIEDISRWYGIWMGEYEYWQERGQQAHERYIKDAQARNAAFNQPSRNNARSGWN